MGGRGGGGAGVGASQYGGVSSKDSMANLGPGFAAEAAANGADRETVDTILRARDHPDRLVRVYRPVGVQRGLIPSAYGTVVITHGQYVMSSRENAEEHMPQGGTVAESQVPASALSPAGTGNPNEWSYSGPERRLSESATGRVRRLQR